MDMKTQPLGALVVCWFGPLPQSLPVWLKSCETNKEFDFLLFSDEKPCESLPENVHYFPFTLEQLIGRARQIVKNPSVKKPYRICDFRPMFGQMFSRELEGYAFWGYCDMDVVFGKLSDYVNQEVLSQVDALFNGGHFSLLRNCPRMNGLYRQPGALFDYRRVARRDGVYAFDETTGIQRIARRQGIRAKYGIAYVEADARFYQIRCRLEAEALDNQAFYWENGKLYRVTAKAEAVYYQELAYIHLQKRKMPVLEAETLKSQGFWITPEGYCPKPKPGIPGPEEILLHNPNPSGQELQHQLRAYQRKKLVQIVRRGPWGVYVRLRQQLSGINAGDGSGEGRPWKRC